MATNEKKIISYLHMIATNKQLQGMHMRILILLINSPMTQAELARKLDVRAGNMNRYISYLKSCGYIDIVKIEGRNIFLQTNLEPDLQIQGQLDINDMIDSINTNGTTID